MRIFSIHLILNKKTCFFNITFLKYKGKLEFEFRKQLARFINAIYLIQPLIFFCLKNLKPKSQQIAFLCTYFEDKHVVL